MNQPIQTPRNVVHYKPYSDSVLGYCVNLNDGRYQFIINSNLEQEEQEKAYNELLIVSPQFEKYGFFLLHSDGVVYYHDSYTYDFKRHRYLIGKDKSKIVDLKQHKMIQKRND